MEQITIKYHKIPDEDDFFDQFDKLQEKGFFNTMRIVIIQEDNKSKQYFEVEISNDKVTYFRTLEDLVYFLNKELEENSQKLWLEAKLAGRPAPTHHIDYGNPMLRSDYEENK